MFPFWPDVVAPIIEAARARRIVEVGALRGEHTELMLQRLGPDVELHVIDPVPAFDPAEHERRFAGQYVFHRDLSVNVLGELAPMDVALIDGDHNWYTVFTELTLLSDVARKAGALMPVMILHDVGWPYGRRDLYYDPSNIPEEHQQPWRRAGMRPDRAELVPGNGGMNADLANAELEGGPRNGVMTGVEDFIAACGTPVRLVVVPIFFGLAVVVAEERLAAQPELGRVLDWIESSEGKDVLLALSESIRVEAVVFDQVLLNQRDNRVAMLTDRYVETVKQAVVHDAQPASATAGLDHLQACLDAVWGTGAQGDLALIGAGVGGSAAFLAAYLEARDTELRPRLRRKLWVAVASRSSDTSTDLDETEGMLHRLDLLGDRVRLLEGVGEANLSEMASGRLALIVLGPGAGADASRVLEQLYPRLTPGGMVVVEDVNDPATSEAVERFRSSRGVRAPLESSGSGAAAWCKEARGHS